jgi:hypothetical protein
MQVVVHSRSKARKFYIEQLSKFYVECLNLDRSRKTVTVYTVPGLKKAKGMLGCAVRDGDNVAVLIDSALSYSKTLITLAHEFVHVKQLALGQLRIVKNDTSKWIWCGRVYDHSNYFSPWEDEAYTRENELAALALDCIMRS